MKHQTILLLLVNVISSVQILSAQFFADEYNHQLTTSVGDYLYGSMIVPSGDSSSTVILFIGDGGSIDRDGNTRTYRNNCLQKLAVALARENIATLRYDKRGVASSRSTASSSSANFDDYVRDASDWIALLKRDGRFKHVLVLGHGQGGLVAMAAISKNTKVDGLILVNCDSRTYGESIKERFSNQSFQVRDIVYSIVDSLNMGYDVEFVPVFLSSTLSLDKQSFARSIMRYDPQDLFRAIRIPSLVVGGDSDIEISCENSMRLSKVNKRSQFVIIAGMNHVLKKCYTIDRDFQRLTYANPALPVDRFLVDYIVNFSHSIR